MRKKDIKTVLLTAETAVPAGSGRATAQTGGAVPAETASQILEDANVYGNTMGRRKNMRLSGRPGKWLYRGGRSK